MHTTTHFETDEYDSHISSKNLKKLRLGIMLNNYHINAWEYTILETITKSDYASIDLVILNECVDEKISFKNKVLSNRDKLLYYTYTKLEERFSQPTRAFTPISAKNLLKNVPVLGIKPKMDKYYDCFQDQDIERIKGFNLDVILQCGFRTLKGDILKVSKYGVWSYHHGGIHLPRGSPPGFWETFERTGEREVVLQILTEDLNKSIVIYRSSFPCNSFFVSQNNNHCFLRSSLFVPRTLKKLYCDGENAFLDPMEIENKKLNFNNKTLYKIPTNFKFLKMFTKHSYGMASTYLRDIFFKRQWCLMYDFNEQIPKSFQHFKKINPPKDRFWADPHIFLKDGIYHIFIEEYIYKKKKGHISLIEMQQSGKYSDSVKVLEEPFHLSYPHVFENNGTIYMIPETRATKSINLYQSTDFPYKWEHRVTIMDSVNAVDSTILFHKNKWWLFTNIAEPDGTSTHNELYLFHSDNLLSQNWKSHPLNPVISDVKRARPAGKILELNGKLYRPSQCCTPWYGYGIKLNEIVVMTENDYSETEIAFIEPNWDKNLFGVHTFCHENKLSMIDGEYYKFVG